MAFVPVQIVGTFETWGSLVLSWACDETTPPPGEAFTDDTALRLVFADGVTPKQLGTAGAGVIFPDEVKEVVFVRDTDTRRYIRLPAKDMVAQAQQDIEAGSDYVLPQFYADAPLDCTLPSTVAQKLKLQKERVGDYSIGICM
jgi:hypothetical protein